MKKRQVFIWRVFWIRRLGFKFWFQNFRNETTTSSRRFLSYFLLDQKVAKNQGCIKFSGKSAALQKRAFWSFSDLQNAPLSEKQNALKIAPRPTNRIYFPVAIFFLTFEGPWFISLNFMRPLRYSWLVSSFSKQLLCLHSKLHEFAHYRLFPEYEEFYPKNEKSPATVVAGL